jgi:prepilin-type N-terminal cleavage/methylation domain-containing protein
MQKLFSKKNNKKAFTLIEMSVTILIIGIIVGGIVGSSKLISKYRDYSDTKKFIQAIGENKYLVRDLTSGFSFANMQEYKNGDEIKKISLLTNKEGKNTYFEVVSDEEIKKTYGEEFDTSKLRNPTYSNSVCGAPAIKFGNFNNAPGDACNIRPLKIAGDGKFDFRKDFVIFMTVSLMNANYKEDTTSRIITNKLCANDNSAEECKSDAEYVEYKIPRSGGMTYVEVDTNKEGVDKNTYNNKGSLIEAGACGNVITYASFTENEKKVKSLYINGMRVSENNIEEEKISFNDGKLYIGSCLFKGAEISKILLYQKNGMDRKYVEGYIDNNGKIGKGKKAGKMKSVFFHKGGNEKRSATRSDRINNSEAKAKFKSGGLFSHEKRNGVIQENLRSYKPIMDCTNGIVKKDNCVKDFCLINKATWEENGELILDTDHVNQNKLLGYNIKIPIAPAEKERYLSCYSNAEDSNKFDGMMKYTCTKEEGDEEGVFEVMNSGKEDGGCRCRGSEGYYWDTVNKKCSPVKCLIQKSDFEKEVLDCVDPNLFNEDGYYEVGYTGNDEKGTIETNENCKNDIAYQCLADSYNTDIPLE